MGDLYDLIVIGSSFGGVMAALPSVMAGRHGLIRALPARKDREVMAGERLSGRRETRYADNEIGVQAADYDDAMTLVHAPASAARRDRRRTASTITAVTMTQPVTTRFVGS